ncbi:hypothetical protein GJW-30_1_03848 [Variibacter gotjawalensis]|uniref:Right handed beta helix domain-containing protein n=1 Tax=Variibacter gotjawalensis TaxID=1333996 RepID=A0A0S3PZE5_9BRAD|nr:TIGR03808 family TAT-translocated repetitive protein [Variibacter gotjawalensis]NIK47129.1 putative secreted repeat protein (TIGR03808 family) [Variibacter gotjawalensis]RZS49031.1 putative secreted repeat protein (TIGR03808 family) [Variibacter gotjawalensis]BAT61291.1 hypothetical protein GJW-30_1_03848 [Variibacter gotjawalensis]
MRPNRRHFLALAGAAATVAATRVNAAPSSAAGVDASQFGVQAGSGGDQTRALQKAIDQAAGSRTPLWLQPGTYRVGTLKLQAGTQLFGVRGATRLLFNDGSALLEGAGCDNVTLSGLILDGVSRPLPEGRGIINIAAARNLRILDCEVVGSSRQGIVLDGAEGEVRSNTIQGIANAGLLSVNARGLIIADNIVRTCGNNGIQVWRSESGNDGTIVSGNRIDGIAARAGGSGQNGNAINVFRANNVYVGNNRITNVAFSAVRGNSASNLQVVANNCQSCGEVALYAEFGFEGAVISQNVVDGASIGVAVTNFDHGGRMATVQGNIIRNLSNRRPVGTDPNDGAGIGIGVEADSAVTGNVIEGAPLAGITIGWGRFLRDVSVTGNVIRRANMGIAVSVSAGAGAAVIADNLIAESTVGAIVGTELKRPVTGDMARDGAGRFAQLAITGNRVR